ncbi:MAG: hypothetical protein ABFS42_15165 [Candidatus Krumholzibacteriota bacterium]
MNRIFAAWLLSGLVFLAIPLGAGAGPLFFKAHGGISSLNPEDVNDGLDRLNSEAGGPLLDHIGSALDAGLSVGYALTPELGAGLGYTRLWAGSSFSDQGYLLEYDLPANLYQAFIDYLPVNGRKIRFGAGANAGMIQSAAALRLEDPVVFIDEEIPFDGNGFLFAGYAIVDAEVAASWSLFSEAGFRHAVIGTVKVDGQAVLNPDSLDDKLRFNYTGFFLRVGIKFQP